MRSAPAFQFYAGDFDASTATMTASEVGIYIRLLCVQWERGHVPDTPKRLASSARVPLPEMEEAWEILKEKFPVWDDGKRRNERMERIRQNQIEYRLKQSEAGKRGAQKRWGDSGANGDPNGDPNSNPINDPNGETVALRSPSPSPSPSPTPQKEERDSLRSSLPSAPSESESDEVPENLSEHQIDIARLEATVKQLSGYDLEPRFLATIKKMAGMEDLTDLFIDLEATHRLEGFEKERDLRSYLIGCCERIIEERKEERA